MRLLQYFWLLAIGFSISMVIQGCTTAPIDHISGRVIDSDTGEPVPGAYVYARSGYYECGPFELGGCGCVSTDASSVRTDSNGYFKFRRPLGFGNASFLDDKFATVAAFKQGYTGIEMPSDINQDSNGDLLHQYIYASGRYRGRNDRSNNEPYKMTTKPVKVFGKTGRTARLNYLWGVASGMGSPACIKTASERVRNAAKPLKSAMCREAKNIGKMSKEKVLVRRICSYAS